MIQRFKNKNFNKAYIVYVSATKEQVYQVLRHNIGNNREQAFRDGLVGYKCKYQRNWILYPIYVAGKEWERKNKEKIDWTKTKYKNGRKKHRENRNTHDKVGSRKAQQNSEGKK